MEEATVTLEPKLLDLFGLEFILIWAYKSLIEFTHPSLYAYVVGPNKLIKPNGLGLDTFHLHLVMSGLGLDTFHLHLVISVFKLRYVTHLQV